MERKISMLFDTLPYELTEGQKNALLTVESGGHVLIGGRGGVGKSSLLQLLKDFYKDEILFCGSTGISNANLFDFKGGAGTAARVWSLPRHEATPKDWKETSKYTNTIFAGSAQILRVVIDEAFMLNSEQLALILHRIKRFNKATKKRPARDIQLILVGDAGQLPPVIKNHNYLRGKYGHELFFLSDTFKEAGFKICFLNQVVRQDDKIYKAALDVIRYGEKDRYDGVLKWFNRRVLPAPDDAVVICPTNKQVDRYNQIAFDRNPNDCFCYEAEYTGNYDKDNCPVPHELFLKEGLKVITLINDPSGEGKFVNGTQMHVLSCEHEGTWCRVVRTGEEVFVPVHEFEEQEIYVERQEPNLEGELVDILGTRVKGTCSTLPLKASSCLSGHRAQGLTIDYPVLVDMGSTWPFVNLEFGVQNLYVILSRPSNIKYLYLKKPLTKEFIKVCTDTLEWLEKYEKDF